MSSEHDAIIDFANAIEAAAVNLKHSLGVDCTQKSQQEKREWTWTPEKIKWIQDTGNKGPYERSEDINSLDFKAMLKDLGEHGGKLNRDGRFYWTFKNGSTVGRTLLK